MQTVLPDHRWARQILVFLIDYVSFTNGNSVYIRSLNWKEMQRVYLITDMQGK